MCMFLDYMYFRRFMQCVCNTCSLKTVLSDLYDNLPFCLATLLAALHAHVCLCLGTKGRRAKLLNQSCAVWGDRLMQAKEVYI